MDICFTDSKNWVRFELKPKSIFKGSNSSWVGPNYKHTYEFTLLGFTSNLVSGFRFGPKIGLVHIHE